MDVDERPPTSGAAARRRARRLKSPPPQPEAEEPAEDDPEKNRVKRTFFRSIPPIDSEHDPTHDDRVVGNSHSATTASGIGFGIGAYAPA